MAREFKVLDRAPYPPYRCAVTKTTGSADNQLIDLNVQIDYYGMVYLSTGIFAAIADQLGYASPKVANELRKENEELKEKITRVPAVIERLSNDIRDISISATADLLSDATPVILVNDKELEQGNSRTDINNIGDDNTSKSDSKSSGGEGPTSVSAGNGSKRKPSANPNRVSSSN